MSFMTHLGHGAVRMGKSARKLLTQASVDILALGVGTYVVHGRCGDAASAAPSAPLIVSGPIDLSGFCASMGFTMLIDVETVGPSGSALYSADIAAGQLLRFSVCVVFRSLLDSASRWNSNAVQQADLIKSQGAFKWECFKTTVAVDSAGTMVNVSEPTAWSCLTAGGAQPRSVPALLVGGKYLIELSMSNNWVIDNYAPSTPLYIRCSGQGINSYDGVASITINTVAAAGAPTFFQEVGNTKPYLLGSFAVAVGKRARIVVDFGGQVATATGVDLPAAVPVG